MKFFFAVFNKILKQYFYKTILHAAVERADTEIFKEVFNIQGIDVNAIMILKYFFF